MIITFEVPEVRGQGRPRFSRFSGAYKDKKDIEYEKLIKECYLEEAKDIKPSERPIIIEITAFFKIPKNSPKYVKEEIKEYECYYVPQTKPDLDNIAKAVLDALNGVAYLDDKQVSQIICNKIFNIKDESEYLRIFISDQELGTSEDIKDERRRNKETEYLW